MAHSILLIEDDQLLREIYLESLRSDTTEVTPAVDGEDALEKLKQGPWDLVLLDMMLPKINGYEILAKIAADPSLKTYKKIVLMTNVEPDKQFIHAVALTDGYITKSEYDPDQFMKKVMGFIEPA